MSNCMLCDMHSAAQNNSRTVFSLMAKMSKFLDCSSNESFLESETLRALDRSQRIQLKPLMDDKFSRQIVIEQTFRNGTHKDSGIELVKLSKILVGIFEES